MPGRRGPPPHPPQTPCREDGANPSPTRDCKAEEIPREPLSPIPGREGRAAQCRRARRPTESATAKAGNDPGHADNLYLPRETGEEAPHAFFRSCFVLSLLRRFSDCVFRCVSCRLHKRKQPPRSPAQSLILAARSSPARKSAWNKFHPQVSRSAPCPASEGRFCADASARPLPRHDFA